MAAQPQEIAPHAPIEIDRRIYELYDEYCHGRMDRREFLARASALVIGGPRDGAGAVPALRRGADDLVHRCAHQGEIRRVSQRRAATPARCAAISCSPRGNGPFPAVLVIHENRGLNPYVEDVARRAAVAGFVALAPDGLSPVGGYPGNDDDGRTLQSGLDQAKLRQDMVNSARFLKSHELSTGKLGATGFCYGGGMVNNLAVALGADLSRRRAVLWRGAGDCRRAEDQGALLIQLAGDRRAHQRDVAGLRGGAEGQQGRVREADVRGTQHGFHNNSTPRYSEAAANLAWERTIAFFKRTAGLSFTDVQKAADGLRRVLPRPSPHRDVRRRAAGMLFRRVSGAPSSDRRSPPR